MAGAAPNQWPSMVEGPPAPHAAPEAAHEDSEHNHAESRLEWARVGLVALVLLVVWSGIVPRAGGVDWLALVGIAIGGYPIFKEAIADVLKGRMTMELSMTIALVAASAIGEFFTALLITIFVLVAEIIEGKAVIWPRHRLQ